MNKLSKEKRDMLILTILGVVMVVGLIFTFGISDKLYDTWTTNARMLALQVKVDKDLRDIKPEKKHRVEEDLNQAKTELAPYEKDMVTEREAQGAIYKECIKLSDELHLDTYSFLRPPTVEFINEIGLLPRMGTNGAALVHLTVHGYYEEIGRFIAKWENKFPFMRIQKLHLTTDPRGGALLPASSTTGTNEEAGANEKLTGTFDVVVMKHPGGT